MLTQVLDFCLAVCPVLSIDFHLVFSGPRDVGSGMRGEPLSLAVLVTLHSGGFKATAATRQRQVGGPAAWIHSLDTDYWVTDTGDC